MLSSKKFILRYIILKILNNEYNESLIIPSENRLAIKFNCSRLTARSALIVLVHNGILTSKQGMGYCVSENALSILFHSLKLQKLAHKSVASKLENFDAMIFKNIGIKNYTDAFLIKNFNEKNKLVSMTFLFINKARIAKSSIDLINFNNNPLKELVFFGVFPKKINTAFINLFFNFQKTEINELNYDFNSFVPVVFQEWINKNKDWVVKTINLSKKESVLFDTVIKL